MIKITRSFARKINLGNYETADFYCQREEEVEEYTSETSERLHALCLGDVMDSIIRFTKERQEPKRVDTSLGEKFQRSLQDQIEQQHE